MEGEGAEEEDEGVGAAAVVDDVLGKGALKEKVDEDGTWKASGWD